MESQILENIEKLYKLNLINLILCLALIAISALVVAYVVKLKILNAKWQNIALILLVVVCSVALLFLQIRDLIPIYQDYTEQSYIIVENVEVVIRDGSNGTTDWVNRVAVKDGEKEFELQIRTEYDLDTEVTYNGKIAYLKHSNYLIWYEFD